MKDDPPNSYRRGCNKPCIKKLTGKYRDINNILYLDNNHISMKNIIVIVRFKLLLKC